MGSQPAIRGLVQVWQRFVFRLFFQFLPALIFGGCTVGLLFCPNSLEGAFATAAESTSPERFTTQGIQALQRGAFAEAIRHWQKAVQLFAKEGKSQKQSETLILLARAYQALGHYTEAKRSLEAAEKLVQPADDRTQLALVQNGLGNLALATGQTENASQHLHEALHMARQLGDQSLTAVILNDLGNVFAAQKRYDEALKTYRESADLAAQANHSSLAASATTNAARAALMAGRFAESKAQLDQAVSYIRSLTPSHDKTYVLISTGLLYRDLRLHMPGDANALSLLAAKALEEAAIGAETIDDFLAASYARGYLGALYEEEGRYEEALQLTRQAVFAAQQVNAPESLYRWQWQTGRLLHAQKDRDGAIAAYRRAVETLQSIRREMTSRFAGPQPSFREAVGQVYFALVDLLLQRAAVAQDQKQQQSDLRAAQDTVELLKAAELRDYFRDDCVDATRARTKKIEELDLQTTAIIYPILLPNRTELLVHFPTGLKSLTVPVGEAAVRQQARELRRTVVKRTTLEFFLPAQQLYDWLVRPLEPDFVRFSIETLVFVPDGPLRTIPMSVLHDGAQFLIRKYAVATTPGLELTDPRPLLRDKTRVLAAGLTESVQGFPPLPNVAPELQAIHQLYGGAVLLDQDFTLPTVAQELQDQPFTIVHLASHGQFKNDVKDTFILTFDERLTMDRLDQLTGPMRFRDAPLELLTLSACETAAGDDRAALGLAGVAVKAGARSALATLWNINDASAPILVAEFYRQLKDPTVSRAVALQRAQLKLLSAGSYRHPYHWSAFLLINNWL
jgi:CHAT domain-containing protein/predicted negative regulator of RcsB-dependent stress response